MACSAQVIVKMIAFGVIMEPRTYFRSGGCAAAARATGKARHQQSMHSTTVQALGMQRDGSPFALYTSIATLQQQTGWEHVS